MLEAQLPRGLSERLLSLRSFSLLSTLRATDLSLLARLSREHDYDVGQVLATEGESVQAVQLLLSGRAELSRAGVVRQRAGAFDTVGLLPVAAGRSHLVTAVAVEPIHALEIDGELADEVLEDDFALFVRVLRLAATSTRDMLSAAGGSDVLARGTRMEPARLRGQAPTGEILSDAFGGPLGAARKLLLLRDAPLFESAPLDGLAAFAKHLSHVRMAAGTAIETGGPAGDLCVIVAGEAEVLSPLAENTVKRVARAGDVVGAVGALTGGAPRLLVRAGTESVHLLRGGVPDLLDTIEDHHAMGRRLLAELLEWPVPLEPATPPP
jgi:CRP-like cAMP-binding protein